ncbi:MAG: hypothetical protein WDO69_05570 [Pseudomonadota bacterium]
MKLEPDLALLVSEAAWNLCLGPAEVTEVLGNPQARAALVAEIVRLLIDDDRPELSDAAREQLGELEFDDREPAPCFSNGKPKRV